MQFDAQNLSAFYDQPLGLVTRRVLVRRLRNLWPDLRGVRLLGYGFAIPYLRPLLPEVERAVALIPAPQGAVAWPAERALVALGEEDALPFADAFFDRILMVHGLEQAESTRPLLRQIWRILAPAGRLIVIAPNRTGLWAQVERSPFAHGRPFSRGQLDRLLQESMFVPEKWDSALYFPPLKSRRLVRSGRGWERAGRAVWPGFAGVHLVEASKSLYALAPRGKRRAVPTAWAPGDA
ncbi:MAG TPA: methyltransferase domain-containing protein [Rhizomicrobium sp.]|jgi:SAM-dependent methyltransferase